jgi:hypothetical protein
MAQFGPHLCAYPNTADRARSKSQGLFDCVDARLGRLMRQSVDQIQLNRRCRRHVDPAHITRVRARTELPLMASSTDECFIDPSTREICDRCFGYSCAAPRLAMRPMAVGRENASGEQTGHFPRSPPGRSAVSLTKS